MAAATRYDSVVFIEPIRRRATRVDGKTLEKPMGAALALRQLATLERRSDWGNILRVWRGRIRLRKHLRRLLRDKPELIDDIGLTIEQAEQEITKPFWRRSCAD